ncbi:MAG TPA: type I secretion system permease/ATPase [Azonexus sp.]
MAVVSDKRSELKQAIWSLRRIFLVAAAFSCVVNVLMLAPSLYMMQVYDRVLTSQNEMTLLVVTLLILGVFSLLGGLEWVRGQLLVRSSAQLDRQLSDRVFNAAFDARLHGRGLSPGQALADLAGLRQFLGGSGIIAFFDLPWIPVYLVVITLLNPLLGLFALVGGLFLLALTWLTERATQQPLAAAGTAAIQAGNFANANLKNAEVIEGMGMLAAIRGRWFDKHRIGLLRQQEASDRASVIGAFTRFVRLAQQSLVLGLGALLVIEGELSSGGMIAASILMGRVLAPVEQVIGAWKSLVAARTSYERLQKMLEAFPVRAERMPLPPPTGQVRLENLLAQAPGTQRPILRIPLAEMGRGEIVGVIGPSASGKSTLARVLMGIWPLAAGTVRLDGADIASWDRGTLGPFVGYLPQDVELFEGTIAENIARFGPVDPQKVVRAAEQAGIHEMILRFPNGYDTAIGPDGEFLSGGQRQRIALARALYGEPVFLVLDEPNSSLDDAGEKALLRAVADLKARAATVVLISHRTSIIAVVDKLLVLKDGMIHAYGPRTEVLRTLNEAARAALPANGGAAA